jgi:hypothetical protein
VPRPGSRGFALATSVFALALIAALIAGVFFAARQEMRLGANMQSAERAFDAAEAGLESALSRWEPDGYDGLPPGGSAAFSGSLAGGTGSFSGTVLRLNRSLFLIRSTGQDPSRDSRRSLAGLVRLTPVSLRFGAAISVTGQLVAGGGSIIRGEDQQPPGRDCPAAGVAVAGAAVRDASALSVPGCADSSCIHGDPPVRVVPTLGDSASRAADAESWAALVAMATSIYDDGATTNPAPAGTSSTCDTSDRDNWGESAVPPGVAGCARHYPVIYARGGLRITGGRGQGILLVDGDLDVEGGFVFDGPVVVRGKLTVAGGGGRFTGGVEASSAVLLPGGAGSAEIAYSRCALADALLSKASARPLAERSWVELF